MAEAPRILLEHRLKKLKLAPFGSAEIDMSSCSTAFDRGAERRSGGKDLQTGILGRELPE